MGSTLEEDQRMSEDEKQWPKTLFKYVSIIFFTLALLFGLAFYSEDPFDMVLFVLALVSSLVIAVIGGWILTYAEHFRAAAEKFEDENVWQYIRMAVIRLSIGGYLIYWKISEGGGFLSGDSLEITVSNFGNFIFLVIGILAVMAGIESLYWVVREVIKVLIGEDEEN